MNNRVSMLNDYHTGTTEVYAAGGGVLCRLPFDKSYLLPEIRRVLTAVTEPIDWNAVKTACQQSVDGSSPESSPADPIRLKYNNWQPWRGQDTWGLTRGMRASRWQI